jgi:lysophospholipid acyltransferase (LPLAT)-like uncharacterized protein
LHLASPKDALIRRILGQIVGWLAWLWLASLRVRVLRDDALDENSTKPWVLSFFHGTQFPLLAWRRRRTTTVMVSHSRDGEMQARALQINGLDVVRGSSSRGGARGLASLVRNLKRGNDAAFAVDGPRGPYGVAKSGALFAARRVGGLLVPMGSAVERGLTLSRAWDKFTLPWPFSRVIVTLGAPLDPERTTTEDLEHAIRSANDRAKKALGSSKPIFWKRRRSHRSRHARPSASL